MHQHFSMNMFYKNRVKRTLCIGIVSASFGLSLTPALASKVNICNGTLLIIAKKDEKDKIEQWVKNHGHKITGVDKNILLLEKAPEETLEVLKKSGPELKIGEIMVPLAVQFRVPLSEYLEKGALLASLDAQKHAGDIFKTVILQGRWATKTFSNPGSKEIKE